LPVDIDRGVISSEYDFTLESKPLIEVVSDSIEGVKELLSVIMLCVLWVAQPILRYGY
jgi:hypothetical protein